MEPENKNPVSPTDVPAGPSPEEKTPNNTPEWSGPSQKDWENMVESNKLLQKQLQEQAELFKAPEELFDPSEIDLSDPYTVAALVNSIVEDRLKGITPYVKTAAQDQGQRQMEDMFVKLEKEFGSFDHDLATRTAYYFFDQTGDAEKSVQEAAKYAAEVRKSEREAGTAEMRSRATRRGLGASDDLSGNGSAVPGDPPARSYDEVIEKYIHQNEL